MPVYGNYETVGNPHAETQGRNHATTVWLARRADQAAAATFAVKLFSPKHNAAEGADTLGADQGLEFIKLLKQQKRAAEGQRDLFIPIHEMGPDPEGVWYATDYYTRGSLKNWVTLRGNVDSAALRNVVASTLAACRQLQTACGRSHGNLKPANIFLGGKAQPLGTTPLFLADPLPVVTESLEARDLRGIGELVLQLVVGRIYHSAADYNYPVAASRAWNDLGKEADYWRDICNRLLDPNLSLTQVNFESLARQFPLAKPSNMPWGMIAIVAGTCVVGGALGFYFLQGHSKQVVEANPPTPPIANSPASPPPTAPTNPAPAPISPPPPKVSEADLAYTNEMSSANASLATNDFIGAIDHAGKALYLRPNDAAALQVKNDALERQDSAKKIQSYTNEMESAKASLAANDFTGAIGHANKALELQHGDAAALQVKNDALAAQQQSKNDLDYTNAMAAARTALRNESYSDAIQQAKQALAIRKLDPDATQLIKEATRLQLDLTNRFQADLAYTNAITKSQTALAMDDYLTASSQAAKALDLRPGDPTAIELQKDAGDRQKKQDENLAYTNAVNAAQTALNQKDYTNAIAHADTALTLRFGDDVALHIRAKAMVEQKADADAEKVRLEKAATDQAYTNAMTAAQSDLDQKDYPNAIAQTVIALNKRPDDAAAKQLNEQATQQQKDAQTAAIVAKLQYQKDLDYTNALTAAQTALAAKEYDKALALAQVALDNRTNAPLANQVITEAQKQKTAAETAAKADTDFTNAVTAAQSALDQKDYLKALDQVSIALILRPGHATVLQLQKVAKALQQVAQAELDQKFTNAMTAAQSALAGKDYSTATTEVSKALAIRPDDEPAKQLSQSIQKAQQGDKDFADLKQQAADASQAGNFTNALTLYQKAGNLRPADPEVVAAIQSLTPKANEQSKAAKLVQTKDGQLSILMRHFGIPAKKGSPLSPDMKAPKYDIQTDQSVVEQEAKLRDDLENWYKANNLMLGDRKDYLDAIKTQINNWGN